MYTIVLKQKKEEKEKDPEVLVHHKPQVIPQCEAAAERGNLISGCTNAACHPGQTTLVHLFQRHDDRSMTRGDSRG